MPRKAPPPIVLGGGGDADGGAVSDEASEQSEKEALERSMKRLNVAGQGDELDKKQLDRLIEFLKKKQSVKISGVDEFEKLAELGSGSGGIVWKVRHKASDVVMAKKLIHLEVKPSVRNSIFQELKLMHETNSPYIVGFWGAFCNDSEVNICMEYMDGGSMDMIMSRSGRIPENVVGKIGIAVVKGLIYLKDAHNILHRDVKPSNILMNTKGEIKLCDFGVSGQLIDSKANSFVGTRSYMSPERLLGAQYSIASDIWSLGLSIVEMLLGRYPIPCLPKEDIAAIMDTDPIDDIEARNAAAEDHTISIFELLQYIVAEEPPTIPSAYFSTDVKDFVDRCLKKDPNERPERHTLLGHPFLDRSAKEEVDVAGFVKNSLQSTNPPSAPSSQSATMVSAN